MKQLKKHNDLQSAIWLMPSETNRKKLQTLIDKLAVKSATQAFPAHLTILAGFTTDKIANIDLNQFDKLLPIQLKVDSIKCEADYFRSVFLTFKPNSNLQRLHHLLKRLYSDKPYLFSPHISLAYLNQSIQKKQQLAEQINTNFEHVELDQLVIVSATDAKLAWLNLDSWEIHKSS